MGAENNGNTGLGQICAERYYKRKSYVYPDARYVSNACGYDISDERRRHGAVYDGGTYYVQPDDLPAA